jgi:uncharacterized protein (TIGR02757 family)
MNKSKNKSAAMHKSKSLGPFLNRLFDQYHQETYLYSDPLEFVHQYSDPWDQEVVALLAALLAYGKVAQIKISVQRVLNLMQARAKGPSEFVRQLKSPQKLTLAHRDFQVWRHRFNSGGDVVCLLKLLERSWSQSGSLGNHFLSYHEKGAKDFESALIHLIAQWKEGVREQAISPEKSFFYLLNSPQDGSCCKRWCLFLRWMGRKDALDPGLWMEGSDLIKGSGKFLMSHQLIMPLDTHSGRISQYLGLTERKSLNWKAAMEITKNLKSFEPDDPIKYDFALSRLGILDLCQKQFRKEICQSCDLMPVCRYTKERLSV